ncbi:MAG: AAA domain-containing protein [Elusimicrobiota bacterium]
MTIEKEPHFEKLLDLLEIEKEAEKEQNKRELEKYPLQVREALGKTVTKLQIIDEDVGVGGIPLLVLNRFSPVKDGPSAGLSPFHAMNQGDNVLLSFPGATHMKPMDGTLYEVGEFQVTIAINGAMPDEFPNSSCQLDMLGSDATYKRMRQAIGQVLRTQKSDLMRLREILLANKQPSFETIKKINLYNEKLNEFQVQAVKRCLGAEDVALIHGPPGTGKTTVLVELIVQSVKNGQKVLASAPSNIAVDNMVEKLLPWGLRIVRMGHPARILEPLRHVTLSALEDEHPLRDQIKELHAARHRLLTQLKRGRGYTAYEKRETSILIDQMRKQAMDDEFAVRRQILNEAQVILATHGGISGMLNKHKFDLVVMDEASQATEPLSWVPITYGKKVVFAGDTCQLPPTLYSKKAAQEGLAVTLFDRMKEFLPEELQTLLRVQYRMHETIMGFSSKEFYEGKLIADDSVKAHTANELPGVTDSDLTRIPLVFIDTAGTGYEEMWNELLESRENEGEANLVFKILDRLKSGGIKSEDVAIITPYVAQVKKLKAMNVARDVEIGSIDSFQGREKEVVIVSLVRSNSTGEVGFLSDTRRMNVGVTRARRLLIVIGDSATISRHKFYQDFLDYVEHHDAHQSAWEWMEK